MPALPGVLGMLASSSPKSQVKQPARDTPVKTKQLKPANGKASQDAAAEKKHQQKMVSDAKNSDEARKRAAELLEANAGRFEAAPGEAEEPSDAADEEDTTWDRDLRLQAAESAWAPTVGPAEGLASSAFQPAAAAIGGALEFAPLAQLLEEVAGGGPALVLRTMTNFMRQLLCAKSSEHREQNLVAALAVLLNGQLAVPHRQLAQAIAAAFGLKKESALAVAPEELPELALAARRKQQVLAFQRRRLRAAEVAAAMDPENVQGSLQERLTKVLGGSAAEGGETLQLVRALQGGMGFSYDLALRAFAQAVALTPPDGSGPPSWPDCRSRAEAMVAAEDAVQQAYSQDGGRASRLVGLLLAGTPLAGLPAACRPTVGVPVLPMRLQADKAQSVAGTLERLGGGPVLAEWCMQGERAQVHVKGGGKEVAVFAGSKGRPCHERMEDAKAALKEGLKPDVGSCVLEVIFVKSGKKAKDDQKEPRVMLAFDMLALNGQPLIDSPLRSRRQAMYGAVSEHAGLKFVRGVEVAPGEEAAAQVSAHLDDALGAAHLLENSNEKGCCKASGLVLKGLDGPAATYWAGRRHSAWLGIEKPPVAGAEADKMLFDLLSEEERKHWRPKEEFHFTVISGFRTRSEEGINDILKIQKMYNDAGVAPTWYVDNECPDEYRKLGLSVVKAGKLIPARNKALVDAYALGKVCVETSDDIGCWQFINDATKYDADDVANAAFKRAQKFNVSPVAAAQYLLAKMRSRGDCCRLGGVYCLSNGGRAMRGKPFGVEHFILGDFFVAEISECRFDEELSLKEDYDFTCSHLQMHGEVYRCNRMLITAKHETNAGGACAVRDAEGKKERYNIAILKKKWPGAIKDHPTRANQIVLKWKGLSTDAPDAAQVAEVATPQGADNSKRRRKTEGAEERVEAKKPKSSVTKAPAELAKLDGKPAAEASARAATPAETAKPDVPVKPDGSASSQTAVSAEPAAPDGVSIPAASEPVKPDGPANSSDMATAQTAAAESAKPDEAVKPDGKVASNTAVPVKPGQSAGPMKAAGKAGAKANTKAKAKAEAKGAKAAPAEPAQTVGPMKAAGKADAKAKAKRKAPSEGAAKVEEEKEGAGAKKASRKQEPDEEEEKRVRSQIYELEEASPEEKASVAAVMVGVVKFMHGKVSTASVMTYRDQIKRILILQARSFRAAATEEYRALVQRTRHDIRSNRTTSCGLSWFARFYAATCEENGGQFKVQRAWEEEAGAEREKRMASFLDEAGREVRTGGQGNFSSKYVGVLWNSRLKRWLAFSKQGHRYIGTYSSEAQAADARAADSSGKKPPPGRSIFSMLGASVVAKPQETAAAEPAATGDDSEVTETVSVVPITDAISLMRIETPVRGKNCTHKAVFDRDSYVEFNAMQEKRKFKSLKDIWCCPICSKPTPDRSLVVAEEFVPILAAAKRKPDVEHIAVHPDGTLSLLE